MFAQCMDNRAQSASRYLALKKKLHQDFAANQVDVYTLNAQDLTKIWVGIYLDRGWSDTQISEKFRELVGDRNLELAQNGIGIVDEYGATVVSVAVDAKVLVALGTDMKKSGNVLGAYRTAVHNGRQYIIFKGNHRLRTTIRGTRYRITNPTIVKMGIGTEGLKAAAKGGVWVTVIVSAGVNGLAWIFDESFGWQDFFNNIAEDVVKAVIAAVAGYFAAKVIAAAFGFVLVSKLVGVGVGLSVTYGLGDVQAPDLERFSENMAELYRQSSVALSDPKALARYGILRAEDALVCSVSASGSIVIESVGSAVRTRIQQVLRRLSPIGLR